MSSPLQNTSGESAGKYEEAIRRMEAFALEADCLQGLFAGREEFLHRLDSLSIQRKNLEGALLIVIIGGTGVGKSTVINAIAGEEVARVSPLRPCTTAMTFYTHRENDLSLIEAIFKEGDSWKPNNSPGLRRKILVDPPDFDSMNLSNRRKLLEVLRVADLILCVVDAEKYRNHSLYRLLYRFREGRSFLFLMNKADHGIEKHVVDDFREALVSAGMKDPRIFLASARNAFGVRTGSHPGADSGDFSALEAVIRNEINKAEIDRIKSSNFRTLLSNTYSSIEQALPPDLIPELQKFPEWAGDLVRETASRVSSEITRALFLENERIRRLFQTAGSLSIGGIFGLYLAVTEKLSSLVAPRLAGSRAQDPVELRAEIQKALDRTDTSRLSLLIDRFSSECTLKIGAMGLRPDCADVKELGVNGTETSREILKEADGLVQEKVGEFLERSASGFLKNITYNILPLVCIVYFVYVAVLRLGKGQMLDPSFFITFVVFLLVICFLQHVLAERGFRRKGGRFMRSLEDSLEKLVQKTLEDKALPKIKAFSELLSKKVRDFLDVRKFIR